MAMSNQVGYSEVVKKFKRGDLSLKSQTSPITMIIGRLKLDFKEWKRGNRPHGR
jgi:hypothetical protein